MKIGEVCRLVRSSGLDRRGAVSFEQRPQNLTGLGRLVDDQDLRQGAQRKAFDSFWWKEAATIRCRPIVAGGGEY